MRLRKQGASSAFVVSVARGRSNLEWWPAWRKGKLVIFENALLCYGRPIRGLKPERAHLFAPRLALHRAGEEYVVSQWVIRAREVERFVRAVT